METYLLHLSVNEFFKIILISILIFFKFSYSFSNIDNKIVIKIENEIITNFEIKNKILTLLILGNQEINQKNINILKKKLWSH